MSWNSWQSVEVFPAHLVGFHHGVGMLHGSMITRPNSKGTDGFLVNHFNSDDKMEEARYVDNINQGGVKDISKGKMKLGDNFLDGSMIGADLQGPATESNQVKEVGLKPAVNTWQYNEYQSKRKQ